MTNGVVISKVLLTPAQRRGLAGTSVIGQRPITAKERQILIKRFGLGEIEGDSIFWKNQKIKKTVLIDNFVKWKL